MQIGTLKKWANLLPTRNTPLVCVLPHGGLQEEQRDPAGDHEQNVRNEKHTYREIITGINLKKKQQMRE